jgi:hypothetical protein
MFEVQVYSGDALVDQQEFTDEKLMQAFADYWQDEGYKVRIFEAAE